jgi:hypothetical protein
MSEMADDLDAEITAFFAVPANCTAEPPCFSSFNALIRLALSKRVFKKRDRIRRGDCRRGDCRRGDCKRVDCKRDACKRDDCKRDECDRVACKRVEFKRVECEVLYTLHRARCVAACSATAITHLSRQACAWLK